MTFGSLFAGIGGIDLGLERAGMEVRWQCEIDDFAIRVLEHHWPRVARHRDVREVGAHNLEPVDLIAGGFPCQDISVAGKGKGLDGERSGLWFEFLRIVQELRPTWVLAENVPALRTRGADVVLDGLAEAGYAAWPLVVGARHVGAPHRRDRVWIVAHREGVGRPDERDGRDGGSWTRRDGARGADGLADTHGGGRDRRPQDQIGDAQERTAAERTGAGSELGHAASAGRGESRRAVDARARGAGPLDEPTGAGEGSAGVGLADSRSDESERRRGCRDMAGPARAAEADAAERERLRDAAVDRGATRVGVGLADADCHGREGERRGGLLDGKRSALGHDTDRRHRWPARPGEPQHEWEEPRTTEPPVGGATSRLSERLAGRHRRASLKALGNSVVPQVVEAIGRAIVEVQHA